MVLDKFKNPVKCKVLQTFQETLPFVDNDWLVSILYLFRFSTVWFSCRKISFQAKFFE